MSKSGPGTLEVDRGYVWALETAVMWLRGGDDPPKEEVDRAYKILRREGFEGLEDRHTDKHRYE